jgi:predicted metalloprotease with PDZ domain
MTFILNPKRPLYRSLILVATTVLLLQSCFSKDTFHFPADASKPYYEVTISKENIRDLHVEALFNMANDTIRMSQSEFSPLADGYATFVHDLSASDDKGSPVSLNSIGKGIWKVDAPLPHVLHIKYDMHIGHDTVNWSTSSAFARGYSVDNVLFFAGRVVFIAPNNDDIKKITVHFNFPQEWKVVTPYAAVPGKADTYEAANLADLWRNGNFIGDLVKEEISIGKLQVIIAGTRSMANSIPLFKGTLSKIINSYNTDMGGSPEGKLAIMGCVSSLQSGGEAFNNSISVMFPQPPDMSNKQFWEYLLSHEIFHLWNGKAIMPSNQPEVEWFVEGFTDYMAKLTSMRAGFITKDEFQAQMAQAYDIYKQSLGNISMAKAGEHKGANYNLIYFGGMTVALSMDIESRRLNKINGGFVEIMKTMYSNFGKTNKTYNYNDLIKTMNEVAKTELSPFFSSYIAGTQLIPLDKYLDQAGLQINQQGGGTALIVKPGASKQQTQMLENVLYH